MNNEQTQQEAVYASLLEPETKAGLLSSAQNLDVRFRSNWFTLEQIMKKTNVKNVVNAAQLMNILELSGLSIKVQSKNGEYKYKITIPKEVQIANLLSQIEEMEKQQEAIKSQQDLIRAHIKALKSESE